MMNEIFTVESLEEGIHLLFIPECNICGKSTKSDTYPIEIPLPTDFKCRHCDEIEEVAKAANSWVDHYEPLDSQ